MTLNLFEVVYQLYGDHGVRGTKRLTIALILVIPVIGLEEKNMPTDAIAQRKMRCRLTLAHDKWKI